MTAVREGRDLDSLAWERRGRTGVRPEPACGLPAAGAPPPEEPFHTLGDSSGERGLAAVPSESLSETHTRLEYP